MNTVKRVSSGVRALVALLLLSVSANQCDNNGADNCDKWTETSNNQPLNTGKEFSHQVNNHWPISETKSFCDYYI